MQKRMDNDIHVRYIVALLLKSKIYLNKTKLDYDTVLRRLNQHILLKF